MRSKNKFKKLLFKKIYSLFYSLTIIYYTNKFLECWKITNCLSPVRYLLRQTVCYILVHSLFQGVDTHRTSRKKNMVIVFDIKLLP